MKTKSLVIHEFGKIEDVLRLEERELPALRPDEVLIRVAYAPINPADINVIEGKYPIPETPPLVLGNEGVGIVEETGSGVTDFKPGQRVITPSARGWWREYRILKRDAVVSLVDDFPLDQASMLSVNPPTAWRMLNDIVDLEEGDWIIQNAANSGVGRAVIHIAKAMGWKTVNVVRREELIAPLLDEGADMAMLDEEKFARKVKSELQGQSIRLGLNAVGGKSATEIAKTLGKSGTLVTYGAMSLQPLELPNGLLIFNDLRCRGYWLTDWYKQASRDDIQSMYDRVVDLLSNSKFSVPIAKAYSLEEAQQAIDHARAGGRSGKVLFQMAG